MGFWNFFLVRSVMGTWKLAVSFFTFVSPKLLDFFICDNASVHVAEDTYTAVLDLLSAAGVTWIRLPTYSPERNPCELVFGHVKNALRNYRGPYDFEWEIIYQLAGISKATLLSYYSKCWIWRPL